LTAKVLSPTTIWVALSDFTVPMWLAAKAETESRLTAARVASVLMVLIQPRGLRNRSSRDFPSPASPL
jgi:hypothetical protein